MAEVDPDGAPAKPHDVLAAEEFGVPARDPELNDPTREPHDVLAAEMFAMPAPDPTIHHAPVVLPEDLTGASEPVDVLAAEEFAMPAAPRHPEVDGGWWATRGPTLRPWLLVAVAAIGVVLVKRSRRRAE